MASIKRRGTSGVSFLITVTKGRGANGKQLRHYMTWTPERQMTEKQMQKEVEKAAYAFENSINLGYQTDNKKTFSEYAEYALSVKERAGVKFRTLERYEDLLKRINAAIGHIRLTDLRPQHLNEFYKNLGELGVYNKGEKATAKVDLSAILKEKKITRDSIARSSGLSLTTIKDTIKGKRVALSTAKAISKELNMPVDDLFSIESGEYCLSSKTILEHHRLIKTILSMAEKEMIVPYNAASKASPPQHSRKQEVNYFQPDDVLKILEALEKEPIKWKAATHLLIVSGCRRGEIMGLKWDKIDFEKNQIKIDQTIQYSSKRGVFVAPTKTVGSDRVIKLPGEVMKILKDYRQWYIEQRERTGDYWTDSGFVFVKDDGNPMMPDSLTAWLRKFSSKHNLPHINPHAFRHTMASILIKNGTDVVSVSKRLGHARTSTTTDIYSHIIKEADNESSECIANVLYRSDHKKTPSEND